MQSWVIGVNRMDFLNITVGQIENIMNDFLSFFFFFLIKNFGYNILSIKLSLKHFFYWLLT